MTICNKIQKVGETMETNLNARGVSCTFGTGTGESTVLDMVEMVNGTNFKGSSDVNLKIGANRPYLLENETTDVIVKLENGLCEPLKNKNVIVGQSVFRDGGVTGDTNSNWHKNSGTDNRTVTATGTTLANTTSTRYDIFAYYGISGQIYVFQPPFTVELDIVDIVGTGARFQIYDKVTLDVYNGNFSVGHWKIVYDGTTIKPYYNGVEQTNYTRNMPNARVGFFIPQNCSITYKNFVIYKTINGVTDEKGEFALYDVSVTDDTTFTATYGTETATYFVEYCSFIDYGITSKHNDSWYNQNSSFTRTRTDNGTNLKITSPSGYQAYFVGGSGTWASTKLYTAPLSVEFEITEITTGTPNFEIRGDNTYFTWSCSNIGRYCVEITGTRVRRYFNGTIDAEYDRTMDEVYSIGFRQNASTEFKYKNFAIYTLTRTPSCLVEYCDFVDYAVTNNKNNTWFNNTGGIITVNDSGTTFTSIPHQNGTHWTCGYCPSSTTSRSPFSYPIIVEFDILHWTDSGSIWIKSDLGNRTSFNRELNHIGSRARIEIGTTSTKIYIDGTLVSEKTYTQPSTYGIEIGYYAPLSNFPTAPSLKFANLSIRPL